MTEKQHTIVWSFMYTNASDECDLVEMAEEFAMVNNERRKYLVHFILIFVILIVIISNIVSALLVHLCHPQSIIACVTHPCNNGLRFID